MLKNLGILQKILFPLTAAMVAGLAVVAVNYVLSMNKMEEAVERSQTAVLTQFVEKMFRAKEYVGLTNAIAIAQNHYVVEALKTGDRQVAIDGLGEIMANYKKYTDFKNIKVHIHDRNAHSFLRAWNPEKWGDDLSGFRSTVLKVRESREPFVAIELGRAGLVLRGLAPIVDGGIFLGSVEFMQGLNSMVKEARELGSEMGLMR